MKREFRFNAGYYEWDLWCNDKLIYSEGDIGDILECEKDGSYKKEVVESFIEDTINYIKSDYVSNTEFNMEDKDYYDKEEITDLKERLEIIESLTDEDYKAIYKAMYNGIVSHYEVK